jgi:hypothetical protein
MLVTRKDIIALRNLSIAKDLVSVDHIPVNFKSDFQLFFFGKTFVKKNNSLFAYPHDVKLWTRYMLNKYKC